MHPASWTIFLVFVISRLKSRSKLGDSTGGGWVLEISGPMAPWMKLASLTTKRKIWQNWHPLALPILIVSSVPQTQLCAHWLWTEKLVGKSAPGCLYNQRFNAQKVARQQSSSSNLVKFPRDIPQHYQRNQTALKTHLKTTSISFLHVDFLPC